MAGERIAVQERGLTAAEVEQRVAEGLVNAVPASPARSVGEIVRANVFTLFNAILGAMLVVILLVGPIQDALFGLVLIANTTVGIVQELRSKRTLDRLTLLTAPRARAIRDGGEVEVALGDVVRDDVLELAAGDQLVVDGKVLASDGLEIDESLLTGEADPIPKVGGDRLLSGSFVAAGAGRYRATDVGAGAYAVRLAEEARRFTITASELRAGTDRILVYVTYAIVPTAILLFWSQLQAHADWRDAMSGAVAGTVAMVPEGLVLLTSVAFAAAVIRLGRRRVLVQELQAVEGLARVDVLCIDKTGTLTEGRLAVERVERLGDTEPGPVLAASAAADPAPNATMLAIADAMGPAPDWTVRSVVPFSSARKWSAVTFAEQGTWVLGAPDVVLPPGELRERLEGEAGRGLRILALGRAGDIDEDGPRDVEPVAVVVLGDRVRADAADTLRYFADQGVTVKVLSGDHPATVGAIAGSLGLDGADHPVDARELEDAELADALEAGTVFGRVTPQQKRAMVHRLRERGHTVAMTGDGVNDALALKESDLGIAMGAGSGATRAVAQLVLLDSTFDALPSVVDEGRRVLGNIERTSSLYLTKTVYAMFLSLATGVAGFVFPFLPRHFTLIGAITIGIPSFFLALARTSDPFRPGYVARVLRFSIPAGLLAGIATFLAYTLANNTEGVTQLEAQTAAVMTLTWVGLLVLTIVASPLTPSRLMLVWSMGAAGALALLLPTARAFFALDPPPAVVWLAGIGVAAITWSFARLFVPADRPIGPRGDRLRQRTR